MDSSKKPVIQLKYSSFRSNFGDKPLNYLEERKRIRKENDEKTARLRALRLAKEAQEDEARQQAATESPLKKRSRKRSGTI